MRDATMTIQRSLFLDCQLPLQHLCNLLNADILDEVKPIGPDGYGCRFGKRNKVFGSVVVTRAEHEDGIEWLHASITRIKQMPSYRDLVALHMAVFEDGWAYQLFAPPGDHVNIHDTALHLWGRADGKPALPNFGRYGTI